MDNESIFNKSIFNESIFKNNTDYDNLSMSESDKNDIKFMLSIMLFVSLCHPCLLIIKDFINRYRDKYKIFKLTIHNIGDNLLFKLIPAGAVCLNDVAVILLVN